MNIQEIITQKQNELTLLSMAYYYCNSCGFVKAKDCYFAVSTYLSCNLCGDEIKQGE